jgi:hypothetical protein
MATLAASSCSSAEPTTVAWCHQQAGLGTVVVGGRFVSCPEISSYEVSPLRLAPGQTGTLSGSAKDVDTNNLSYSWSAESGVVADPHAAVTNFMCKGGEGIVKLTFVVSDGRCQDAVEAAIDCIP